MHYDKKSRLSPIIIILITCLIFGAIQYSTTLFSSIPVSGPWGKIISPADGTATGTKVNVTAETKNIEPGQYVWLAVDQPGIGLCWPKIQIKPDTKFKTIIYEEGKKGSCTLSLYVVHKIIHDQWQDWLDNEMQRGLPVLPEKRRLDSVQLILE